MHCLLCSIVCKTDTVLKKHYIEQHSVKPEDPYFKDLFLPDTIEKTCQNCRVTFKSCRTKKVHMFLFHYDEKNQIGGRRPSRSALPLNVLKRGSITYYSINFSQHKKCYDFHKSDVLDSFLDSVYETFRPTKDCKFQGYSEIVNQQKGQDTILEDACV